MPRITGDLRHWYHFWRWEKCKWEATPPSGLFIMHFMRRVFWPFGFSELLVEPTGRGVYHELRLTKDNWEKALTELTDAKSFEELMAIIRRYQESE